MANKKDKAPKKAPAAPAAQSTEKKPEKKAEVLDMTNFVKSVQTTSVEGLDPNRRVDLLRMLHETFRMDVNAAERYHMSPETIAKINEISAIGQIAALACEVTYAKNPFAVRMNLSQLEAIKEVGTAVGVSIDTKALPAPDESGAVEISSEAIKVDKETKEKIKAEEEIREVSVELDPNKIENEEQLILAIKQIMVTRENVFQKINESLNFYQAYRKIQASRSDDKNALEKENKVSRIDLLRDMAKLVGDCPLVMQGVGRYMYQVTATSKSPITAFCMFRNTTKNRKTGAYALSDEEIAEYVRTLVEWTTDLKIAKEEQRIDELKKNLEVLKKDEKKNEKGIKDTEEKIETATRNIQHFKDVISYVACPTNEVPANFIENYLAKDTTAIRTFKAITDSYYDDIVIKEMKQDGIRHNVEQLAGIITNMFRDPTARLEEYSEANLVDLEPIPENKPAEEATHEAQAAEAEQSKKE